MFYTTPKQNTEIYTCMICSEPTNSPTWYNIGISLYSKEKGYSHIQSYNSHFCCSPECAREHAHKQIENLREVQFGLDYPHFNSGLLHAPSLVNEAAIFTALPRAWSTLPQVSALDGGELSDDIYIAYADRWSNDVENVCLQGCYQQATGQELATANHLDCITLLHRIVDEILDPCPEEERFVI